MDLYEHLFLSYGEDRPLQMYLIITNFVLMKTKAVEIITLVTRFLGALFFIYTVLCFGVLEKYNLRGIGNYSAYTLYWKCLNICCLILVSDFVAQILKLAARNASWPKTVQTLLYLASFILVAVMVASYHGLTCDGDRHEITALWPIEEQIKSVRECVLFDGLYMGIRSLIYSLILVKGKQRVA